MLNDKRQILLLLLFVVVIVIVTHPPVEIGQVVCVPLLTATLDIHLLPAGFSSASAIHEDHLRMDVYALGYSVYANIQSRSKPVLYLSTLWFGGDS